MIPRAHSFSGLVSDYPNVDLPKGKAQIFFSEARRDGKVRVNTQKNRARSPGSTTGTGSGGLLRKSNSKAKWRR